MILVSQSYIDLDEVRNEELQKCKKHNEDYGLFDRVEYLDGGSRVLSFGELHEHCVSKYRGQWCVIANSDIMFNATAYMLKGLKKAGRLVALTRWDDYHGPRIMGKEVDGRLYSGTQDSWAFLAGSLPEIIGDIPLGVIGCDQVIAGWAAWHGVEVINPALSIKTTHVHSGKERPSDRKMITGFFGYPHLTTMHTSGDVMCHYWPREDGKWEQDWRLYQYKK
jgi:hypothetical protein